MTSSWLLIESPVFTTAVLAALGYWARAQRRENTERDNALARQSEALAVLVESMRPVHEWRRDATRVLSEHGRAIASLRETSAVLAATLEHHEAWHEREGRHSVDYPIHSNGQQPPSI